MDPNIAHNRDTNSNRQFHLGAYKPKSPLDWDEYDKCLEMLPETPFIKKELLPNNPEQQIAYFTLYDKKGTLLVLLPVILRKILLDDNFTGYYDATSPYGYGGPVFRNGIDEIVLNQFWNELDAWYLKNNVVSEFIRFNFNENWKGYTGNLVPTLKNVCGKVLPEDDQWKSFKPKVRNNVRKALQYGLNVNIHYKDIKPKAVQEFYDIYIKTMGRHQAEKQYYHNLDYFRIFIENNPESCAIATVYHNKIHISTELVLLSEDAIYSFLGGTDSDYFHMRPNDLLKLKMLEWARNHDFRYYHLGGGRQENDSLYSYKKDTSPKMRIVYFTRGAKYSIRKFIKIWLKITNTALKVLQTSFRFTDVD